MNQREIKEGQTYIVKTEWFGGRDPWTNGGKRGVGTFFGTRVEATVIQKQVARNGRRDGIRIQLSPELFEKIPEIHRRGLGEDVGANRMFVIPSRQVVETVEDKLRRDEERKLEEAEREVERKEKVLELTKGIKRIHIGEALTETKKKAGVSLHKCVSQLRYLANEATTIADAVEAGTEQEREGMFDHVRVPAEGDLFPKVGVGRLERYTSSLNQAVREYEGHRAPYNILMDKREEEEEEENEPRRA